MGPPRVAVRTSKEGCVCTAQAQVPAGVPKEAATQEWGVGGGGAQGLKGGGAQGLKEKAEQPLGQSCGEGLVPDLAERPGRKHLPAPPWVSPPRRDPRSSADLEQGLSWRLEICLHVAKGPREGIESPLV